MKKLAHLACDYSSDRLSGWCGVSESDESGFDWRFVGSMLEVTCRDCLKAVVKRGQQAERLLLAITAETKRAKP